MSSHILGEVDRLATRIGIVHRGRLVEELDSDALERHRDRRLEVGARDLERAEAGAPRAGLHAVARATDGAARPGAARPACDRGAREIAALLVAAGAPPTRLAVARESLEDHFIRLTSARLEAASERLCRRPSPPRCSRRAIRGCRGASRSASRRAAGDGPVHGHPQGPGAGAVARAARRQGAAHRRDGRLADLLDDARAGGHRRRGDPVRLPDGVGLRPRVRRPHGPRPARQPDPRRTIVLAKRA